MGIQVQSDCDTHMAKAFRDSLRAYTLLKVQRGHRMSQIMESDASKSEPLGQPPERQSSPELT